jgi:hypothetical protein
LAVKTAAWMGASKVVRKVGHSAERKVARWVVSMAASKDAKTAE